VTEEAQTPPAAPEPPKPSLQPERPIARAFAQHMHAVLIGSFTILASVVSAFLGYYFAHEDQKRLLALEYDKLRAERTLEISKALTRADTSLQAMIVTGRVSSEAYCKLATDLASLQTDLAKVRPMPKVYGTLTEMLTALDALIRSAEAPEASRQALSLRLEAMKAVHTDMDRKIQADWKKDDDIRDLLDVDTAATMKVYYRDYSLPLAGLTVEYGQISIAMRNLILKNGECAPKAEWDAIEKRWLTWSQEAFDLTTSLGLALAPE
jgi:hypothetical protein